MKQQRGRIIVFSKVGAIAGACALVLGTAWATRADAMGMPTNGGMDLLLPNTVTVEGSASEAIQNPVADISYSMNIEGDSLTQVTDRLNALERHYQHALHSIGLPTGNILYETPSYNTGNNGPTASLQMNVVVSDLARVPTVMDKLGAFSPLYIQNSYSNVQVVPLNPQTMWPSLYDAAMKNARQQAARLAESAGMRVGSVEAISTVPAQGALPMVSGPYPSSPSVAGMQYQYNSGGQAGDVSAQIYVTFALRQSK